ncbi:hypothetical protein ASE12_17410 [Aeromicrobium sp. Root236]|uniref:hypothetical protein n=1 Tax=Aeromicrobium sp. Root236 TaxID=1736498 RepID=UPI000701B992|nr:hypothetical protein [Aeromicrobium sp. Root236]KRC66381.1 hypothetical protein ASE12_17410 [Aeromicrobium sp. Root236]
MARSSPAASAALIALGVHVGVGIPIYFWAGLSTYFMNDLPTAHDNVSYLRWGVISALLSATALVLLSVRNPRGTWRAIAFAAATAAVPNGAWLAFFFGTQISDLGDDSGTTYDAMSTSTVRSIATACVVAAVIGLVVAVVSRPRRAHA